MTVVVVDRFVLNRQGSFDNQDTFQDDEDSSDAAEDELSERGEDEADLG